MKTVKSALYRTADFLWNKLGLGIRNKLLIIFLLVSAIPLSILTIVAWRQLVTLSEHLSEIATNDASAALNNIAIENIERTTTDMARALADFLYARDSDILYLAGIAPSEENFRQFAETQRGRLKRRDEWELTPDGNYWVPVNPMFSGKADVLS